MEREKCFQIINTIKSIALQLRSPLVCGLVTGLLSALVLTLSFAQPVGAAPGDLDLSFSGDGKVTTDFGGDERATAIAIQADGKIVAAGFSEGDASGDFALARYNTNGSLDSSFSGDGKVTTNFGGSSSFDLANAMAIQADGKIVVAGASDVNNGGYFALARYNTNGSLDSSFSGDGLVTTGFTDNYHDDEVSAIALQTNGKIVVAGFSRESSSSHNFALARYHAIECAGFNATIVGTMGSDSISGTQGNDVIQVFGGDDTVSGLGGNDTICGNDGNDTINGGYGPDTLRGDRGNDNLNGGPGNDSLAGGAGTDSCNGDIGTDSAAGCETIISVP